MARETSVRDGVGTALQVLEVFTITEERPGADGRLSTPGSLRAAVAVVVKNPLADRDDDDLSLLVDLGEQVGRFLAERALQLIDEVAVEAVGQGAIVGLAGEAEHAASLLGAGFAAAVRAALPDWRPAAPSTRKLGGPGSALPVELSPRRGRPPAWRSSVEVRVPGRPADDEAVVVLAVSAGSRAG